MSEIKPKYKINIDSGEISKAIVIKDKSDNKDVVMDKSDNKDVDQANNKLVIVNRERKFNKNEIIGYILTMNTVNKILNFNKIIDSFPYVEPVINSDEKNNDEIITGIIKPIIYSKNISEMQIFNNNGKIIQSIKTQHILPIDNVHAIKNFSVRLYLSDRTDVLNIKPVLNIKHFHPWSDKINKFKFNEKNECYEMICNDNLWYLVNINLKDEKFTDFILTDLLIETSKIVSINIQLFINYDACIFNNEIKEVLDNNIKNKFIINKIDNNYQLLINYNDEENVYKIKKSELMKFQ